MPQHDDLNCRNLFFDESIIAKANRSKLRRKKVPTPFIADTSQAHHSEHVVPTLASLQFAREFVHYPVFPIPDLENLERFEVFKVKPPNLEGIPDWPRVQQRPFVPESDKLCVLTCWFDMWAACLWYHDACELDARLEELSKVIDSFKDIPRHVLSSMYRVVLQAAAQVHPLLTLRIYSKMTRSEVLMDAATVQILQKAAAQVLKQQATLCMRNTGRSLEFVDYELLPPDSTEASRERVFTLSAKVLAKQEACIMIKETCPECQVVLKSKEIRNGWRRETQNFECTCINCGSELFPKIRVKLGEDSAADEEATLFVSPQALRMLVTNAVEGDNRFHLQVDLLRTFNSQVFWNLVWHFSSFCLPYEFIMPYASSPKHMAWESAAWLPYATSELK